MISVTTREGLIKLKQDLLTFMENRDVGKEVFLPNGYEIERVTFGSKISAECSLCGCNIGYDEEGEEYLDSSGYLVYAGVRRKQTILGALRKALLCSHDMILLKNKSSTKLV